MSVQLSSLCTVLDPDKYFVYLDKDKNYQTEVYLNKICNELFKIKL